VTFSAAIFEQSAKIFDKDELAAILRFGAEKLFKNDAKDDDKASPEVEEDIDDILARAEKVENNASGQPGGATDLLNQFNYATFKNEEDDATFWNLLIPKDERT
jgi:chromodomain-helicase-DNA-binding protein 1